MSAESIVVQIVDALEAATIPYMLVGSFSSNLYGIPRSTKDADFVVQLGHVPLSDVIARLNPEFILEPQMSFETITGTYRYILRHSESAFTVEFFLLSDQPHDRERFTRKHRKMLAGRQPYLPTAEDVIITKLFWSRQGKRTKDVEDVQSVIAVQQKNLDWDYIHRWCDTHSTRELLASVVAMVPK